MTNSEDRTRARVATSLQVHLLGKFQVSAQERAIPDADWRRRRAKHLVALLALTPGHILHRDQVLDTFWPNAAPDDAANSLYQTLHVARRILCLSTQPCNYLQLRAETLSLCLDGAAWVDIEVFEAEAKGAQGSQDPQPLRAALQLYMGELLPEERYESWTQGPRDRLHRIYLEALLELARRYEAEADHQLAIETLRRAVEVSPLEEAAHAALMRIYARTGQRQTAIEQFRVLENTLRDVLGAEPAPQHKRLYEDIVSGRLPLDTEDMRQRSPVPAYEPPTNFPTQLTSFIGREREKAAYIAHMRKHRLVTLIGPGGCGKTRLALEVATALRSEYAHGVWLVELATLQDPTQVPQAVVTALGLRDAPGQSILEALVAGLQTKQVLLVLDNCEHLVEAAARLTQEVLQHCPSVRILATSREPLHAPGEIIRLIPSLTLPDRTKWRDSSFKALLDYESVRLFCERAQEVSSFALTDQNADAVVAICHRLDGIPLAIELAATRLGILAPEQIAARLDNALALLRGGSRTALTRQQTLSATLNWSHDLLSDAERIVFRRMSVFAGAFPLEAVEAICAGPDIDEAAVTTAFLQVAEKSLVAVEPSTGSNRYHMLEVVRQYAAERLRAAGETAMLRDKHLFWHMTFAEETEPQLRGELQADGVSHIEYAHENLRAALRWSLEHGDLTAGLRLASAVWRFWYIRGYLSEGRNWLSRLIERAKGGEQAQAPSALAASLAGALAAAGALAESQGDYASAVAQLKESLGSYRALQDTRSIAGTLNDLGNALCDLGEYAQATVYYEEGLDIFQALGDPWGLALVLGNLGPCAYEQGEYARARAYLEEALALSLAAGAQREIALTLANLGVVALRQGETQEAKARYEEGLAIASELEDALIMGLALRGLAKVARRHGAPVHARMLLNQSLELCLKTGTNRGIADTLEGFAGLADDDGQSNVAAHLLGAAAAICEIKGIPRAPDEQPIYERQIALLRDILGKTAFQTAWEEGHSMSLEDSVAFAYALVLGTNE